MKGRQDDPVGDNEGVQSQWWRCVSETWRCRVMGRVVRAFGVVRKKTLWVECHMFFVVTHCPWCCEQPNVGTPTTFDDVN